jgi:hypothetical protein
MKLKGARADGTAVRDALKRLGYRVVLLENASTADIRSLLANLRLLEAEGGTFVVYYSGQAVARREEAYIVPSDLPASQDSGDVPGQGVSASELLGVPEGAQSGVLYAAQLGEIAYDLAPGRATSPFASAFIDNLREQVDVFELAENITRDVTTITGGKQKPELTTAHVPASAGETKQPPLVRRFVFFDGCRIEPSAAGER